MGSVRSLIGLILFKDTSKFCETVTEISHQFPKKPLAVHFSTYSSEEFRSGSDNSNAVWAPVIFTFIAISYNWCAKTHILMLATRRKITSFSKCQTAHPMQCRDGVGTLSITHSLQQKQDLVTAWKQDLVTAWGEKLANTDVAGNKTRSSVGGSLPLELVWNQSTAGAEPRDVLGGGRC